MREYGKFKASDFFTIVKGKRLTKADMLPGHIPFIGSSAENNGITAYIGNTDNVHPGGQFTVSYNGSVGEVFLHEYPFVGSDDVNIWYPKKDFTREQMLYFMTAVKQCGAKYSYTSKWTIDKMREELLSLPLIPGTTNQIDWQYMHDYIRELEDSRIKKLDVYLKATDLNNYELTAEEEQLLDDFRDGKIKTKKFKVGDLFDASTGDVDLQQKDVNGKGTYFINSGLTERGIKGKTDRPAKIFPANTITIDFWGNAFYRDFDYKMATHNHVFSLSGDCIKNKRVGLFLSSALSKFTNVFSYSNMGTWTKIKEMTISLPVTPSCDPDYDLMDRYIRAIEKTVIRDVVNWKSKELGTKNAASDS